MRGGMSMVAVAALISTNAAASAIATVAMHSSDARPIRITVVAADPSTTYAAHPALAPPVDPIVVSGRSIPSVGVATVRDALQRARVVPHDGRWLGVVSHRAVGYNGDHAQLYVDGAPAGYTTGVAPGATITITPGTDRVEGTRLRRVVTPADPTG